MPALEKDTFDLWREGDDQFKQEMRDHIKAQNQLNLKTTEELATVKTRTGIISGLTSVITTVITIIISGRQS